ncbi:MAG TPA: hypothetical protein VHE34_20880 [Puia sp.]|uniref:hypothetical protein n=1 Tax=Puia sp. TaxID=2045100 RepID=UPI002CD46A7B|nr:hypothetical protein [Puia sp.]HVU97697.1 hypothetical protein [Puia sp.]
MEKYAVSANFSSPATKESYALYNYGPAVNTTADYPASGVYSIHSAQKDNFSATFIGIKPSYYNLTLTSGNLHWQLYASPDSAIVNPLALITAQNSKLLQGQSFGTLSLSAFGYLNVPGLGFSDYFNLATDPVLIQNKYVMHWDGYGKTF